MNENSESEELNSQFLKELFGEELYPVGLNQAEEKIKPDGDLFAEPQVLPLHGNTAGKILLLLNYPGKNEIPSDDRTFLANVVKAVQLDARQIAWLNEADVPQLAWEKLSELSYADVILAFGVNPKLLPQGINKGEIYTLENKRVMNIWPLSEISNDNNKKKVLWQGLKEIFNL